MQRVDISNFQNKKVALVMSGGVVKAAAWHLGVALALEELGFTFKRISWSTLKTLKSINSLVDKLINLANELDQRGLVKEADVLDNILKYSASTIAAKVIFGK